MALNVKVAMLICTGFISGLCWLVSQVALPSTGAVFSEQRESLPAAVADKPPAAPAEKAREPALATDGSARFGRGSPFELQAAANRASEPRLAAAPVPAPTPRAAVLPPLARPEVVAPTFAAVAPDSTDSPANPSNTTPVLENPGTIGSGDASRTEDTVTAEAPVDAASPAAARTYKVQKNDSLAKVARQQFKSGDARLLQLLIEANPKLRKRPNKLLAGETLVIPDVAVVDRVLHGEKPALALKAPRTAPRQAAAQPPAEKPGDKSAAKSAAPPRVAQVPTDKSADKSAAKLAEKSAAKLADTSTAKPASLPRVAEAPVAKPADKPADKPAARPTDKAAAKLAEKGSAKPADKIVAKPADKGPVKPADKVAAKPAEKPAAKPSARGKQPAVAQTATDSPKRTAAAKPRETAKPRWYTIQPKDSLKSIAARQLNDGKRWREIAEINGLDRPDKIVPGRRIKLPEAPAEPHG